MKSISLERQEELTNNISSIVNYYLSQNIIDNRDAIYCFNRICMLTNCLNNSFNINSKPSLYDSLNTIFSILNLSTTEADILGSNITNVFIPLPSIINQKFNSMDKLDAIKWFFNLSISSNYIKTVELKKNKSFYYNNLKITINLSKPEKDPKDIAKLVDIVDSNYPSCPLCLENEGFVGATNKSARSNHRTIDLKLENKDFFMQFSPYMYYDQHLIVIEKKHCNMVTNIETLKQQLDFVDQYPFYFIGNNADLPLVGGSILNHNHFQGGTFDFPIKNKNKELLKSTNGVDISVVDWYLATLFFTSKDKNSLIDVVNIYYNHWKNYHNERIMIYNSNEERHNSVNFITYMDDNNNYNVIMMLRNNYSTIDCPLGVFHPSDDLHHIKKENIGLIEAMGLAILPGRLDEQINEFKMYLLGKNHNVDVRHLKWLSTLQYDGQDIEQFIHVQIGIVFEQVLQSCHVFKFDYKEFGKMLGEI